MSCMLSVNVKCHFALSFLSLCDVLCVMMLSVIMLDVIMLSVIMLSAIMLSVFSCGVSQISLLCEG